MSFAVSIVMIDDAMEALLLRAQLESLGARVHLYPVGKPSDFFEALGNRTMPVDMAIICGHGDADGLIFPEMAEGVDSLVLPANRLQPAHLARLVPPMPEVVVSTACGSGTAAFVGGFHAAGVETFVAPVDYPSGAAVPISLGLAFYLVLHRGLPWAEAVAAANQHFAPDDAFGVYRRLSSLQPETSV